MLSSSAKTMRGLVLTHPPTSTAPVLEFSESLPIPRPSAGHLLVKIHASAIQPSDILNARGGFASTVFPRIPGRDFSGVVVDGPADRIGQTVFGTSGSTHSFTVDGFHAEYAIVPEAGAAPKPEALSHVQAATVGVPLTTAALTLHRAGADKGDTVLVLGAGGAVGRTACVVAEGLGCMVLRGVRGAAGDVDTAADPTLSKVAELTGGKGVDVVVDTVGLPALTRAAVAALAQGGRLAFIAAPRTAEPADLAFDMKDFYRKEKTLVGCNSGAQTIESMSSELKRLDTLLTADKWKEIVDGRWEEIGLKDAVAAYSNQEKGKKFVIKVA